MRTLFLLFASLSLSSAGLLGSEKCSWGPSYWCSGIPQSAKCKATSHCIENYWENAAMPEDDDDVCTICKNMVAEARDTLQSNETQTELREVFEGSCQLIPVKIISKECIKLVDQFIPELVETLASEMNPGVVCSTAGLCNSKRIDKLLTRYYSRHPKTACDICRSEVRKVTFRVREADKDLVLDKALEMCGYLSSYSDACRATVLDNFDTVYEFLTTKLDSTVCDMTGLCPDNSNAITLSASQEDVQCEFCEKVIQHWKDEWTANATIDEFKEVMEQICKRLDKKRVDHCLHIVDDYYIPAFNYIAHELDPHMLCSLVGLCGNNGFLQVGDDVSITMLLPPESKQVPKEERPLIRMLPLQPAIKITGNENLNQPQQQNQGSDSGLIGGYFMPSSVAYANKPTCAICEYVLHELQNWIGDERTEEKVEDGLKKICGEMPNSVEAECKHFIDTYGPAIVELFIHDLDPSTMCPMLGLCDEGVSAGQVSAGQVSAVAPLDEIRGDGNCALCEYAMNTLLEVIKDKTNQDEIRNALDGLCGLLPQSLDDECEKFVDGYAETIIDLISQGVTADEICQQLGLCKAKVEHVEGNQCVLCEYIVQTLDGILEDKTDEAKIKQALDELCGYMPKTVTKQCVTFVDTYSDLVIDLLTHDVTPQQLCAEMGLCAPSKTDSEIVSGAARIIETNSVAEVQNDRPYCTLCEYAIGEVDKLITDKKNEDEIRDVLDKICYKLSNPIMKECKAMVDQYLDEIVEMFVQEYTPAEVCAELKLCNPVTVVHHHENAIPPMEEEEESDVKKASTLCVLCEFGMKVLEDQLLNNRTFDMVERGVQMLCSYMPQSVAQPCEQFVDEYGDKLIHLIVEQELDPQEVCAELQLCDEAEMWDASVYGGHRCNWGPSYWCQSRFHAMACGTTKHCMQTVWK